MSVKLQRTILMLAILMFLDISPAFAKKMYRWVDESGNTYFSDQIPPEHSKHRRETLNERGRIIDITDKAKTKEQQELEKRLSELRKAQEKIIEKQKAYDKVLLSTFRNLDDLMMAIKSKSQSMEAQIQAADGNLSRLQTQLENQQKKAAEFERNAQKVPQKLLDDIKATQSQIQEARQAINKQIEKLHKMERENDADVERYLFLTQSRTEDQPRTDKIASIREANALGLFYCQNDHQCNKAWKIARNFVNFHSTTAPDIDNEQLIMSRAPSKDSDLSLSLSKIAISDTEYQLFLDIRCRDSSLGKELCASQKVSDIRSAFRPYINNVLSRTDR
ncbi:MAG: DUF4124 domain-containing protein [Gammaproteobacteria bacterium]